ncbi:MAG: TRAP transporter small permease subunit [Chloroflexi bacterium]|nr:TRAP transporter small permease subunit [Chloroflexota bacterium]
MRIVLKLAESGWHLMERAMSAAAWIGNGLLLALTAIMLWDVVARRAGLVTMLFAEELGSFAVGLICAMGAAYTLKADKHIRAFIIYQRFSPRTRYWIDMLAIAVGLVYTTIVIQTFGKYILTAFQFGRLFAGTLSTPVWIPGFVMLIGLILLWLMWVVLAVRKIRGFAAGDSGSREGT